MPVGPRRTEHTLFNDPARLCTSHLSDHHTNKAVAHWHAGSMGLRLALADRRVSGAPERGVKVTVW